MPRRIALAALACAALAGAAQAAAARSHVEAREAWSRPAAAGTTGVGYLVLENRGDAPAVLTGASSPRAARVEMHSSSTAGGMMRMAMETKVTIPPHGQVAFAPGGRHLMFIGLKTPLKPGDRLPAELKFADGARLTVELGVGDGLGPPKTAVR